MHQHLKQDDQQKKENMQTLDTLFNQKKYNQADLEYLFKKFNKCNEQAKNDFAEQLFKKDAQYSILDKLDLIKKCFGEKSVNEIMLTLNKTYEQLSKIPKDIIPDKTATALSKTIEQAKLAKAEQDKIDTYNKAHDKSFKANPFESSNALKALDVHFNIGYGKEDFTNLFKKFNQNSLETKDLFYTHLFGGTQSLKSGAEERQKNSLSLLQKLELIDKIIGVEQTNNMILSLEKNTINSVLQKELWNLIETKNVETLNVLHKRIGADKFTELLTSLSTKGSILTLNNKTLIDNIKSLKSIEIKQDTMLKIIDNILFKCEDGIRSLNKIPNEFKSPLSFNQFAQDTLKTLDYSTSSDSINNFSKYMTYILTKEKNNMMKDYNELQTKYKATYQKMLSENSSDLTKYKNKINQIDSIINTIKNKASSPSSQKKIVLHPLSSINRSNY